MLRPLVGPWRKRNSSSAASSASRYLGEVPRVEEVVLHELDDQRHVDMRRPLELGQRADVPGRHLEVGVLLESLGGDDVPEQVDHLLALHGDLHLHHGIVEQVAPVFGDAERM